MNVRIKGLKTHLNKTQTLDHVMQLTFFSLANENNAKCDHSSESNKSNLVPAILLRLPVRFFLQFFASGYF